MTDNRFVRQEPNPIPLDALKPPEFDVREYRTEDDIENTARTLEAEGQVLPILVGEKANGQYPILDGNHRYLAAKRLGWPNIDCIRTKAGVDEDEVQIVANLARFELSPSERLAVLDFMLNNIGMAVTDAADRLGIDRSQAHRYKKILTGYGEIKQFYMQGDLGVMACYELNQIDDRDRAVDIAETAIREGYVDADVVEQARNVRGEEAAEDVMRGAGDETNVQNIQQVRRNAQELGELDPIDEEGIRAAQVAPDADHPAAEGEGSGETADAPEGPPCHGCGQPMQPGPLSQFRLNPELAEQLGVDELRFGAECTGRLIDTWVDLQDQADVETDSE